MYTKKWRAIWTKHDACRASHRSSHAVMTAYAASLLEFDCVATTVTDSNQPLTCEVLAEATRISGLDCFPAHPQSSHHSFRQEPSRPRQPSLVGFPVRTARQPCVHHDPLWSGHNIPTAYLPHPALETLPSRVTSVSSPLSVPSHSRSLGRPPFSLCPGRGTSIPRSPTGKSSRQSLPRSRRPRDYKHRQHPAAR